MKTSHIAMATAMFAAATPALAQDKSWTADIVVTGEQEDYTEAEAATATRTATPIEKIPQSIQTLTSALIQDQDLQNLSSALVNVSGVTPNGQAQTVLQATLVRGFSVNTFIDGVPTYQLPAGVGDPATLVNVERIEVAKGPSSTLYGGGTGAPLAGLVNLASKNPHGELALNGAVRVGSYNTYGAEWDVNLPVTTGIALRVTGMRDKADSRIDFVTADRVALFPTLSVDLGAATQLIVRGRYNKLSQTEYAGLPYELLDPTQLIDRNVYAGSRDMPRTWVKNWAVTGTLTHQLSDAVTAEITGSRTLSRFEEWGSFPYGRIAGTTYNFGIAFLPSDSQKTYVTGTVTAKIGTGDIRQTLLVGVDYDHTNYYGAMYFNPAWATIDYANPLPAPAFGATPPPFFDQTDRMRSIAVFAQDQISLGDALDITLGLRWTKLKVTSDVGFAATDERYEKVTPRIGATLKIAEGVTLFGGYSEGFQGVVAGGFYGISPKPETSQAWEGGLKFAAPIKGLTGTFAVYNVTRQNVLTSIPNTFFYSQAGEQRAKGVELDLIYEPSKAVSVLFAYGFTNATVTEDTTIPVGSRLRAVPRHTARLAGRYRFLDGGLQGLEIGAGITAVSKRELTLPNTLSVEGQTLVDAQLAYDLGPVTLGLSITNVLNDKGYQPHQYFGGAYVYPTQPRSAVVTARFGF